MKARHYKTDDYPIFKAWCAGHHESAPAPGILPPCGVVIEDEEGAPLAIGFLYMAVGVGCAWLAWATTNPKLSPWNSLASLDYLECACEKVCSESDYGVLFTMTDREGLGAFLRKRGFVANHKGATQYFKEVGRGS